MFWFLVFGLSLIVGVWLFNFIFFLEIGWGKSVVVGSVVIVFGEGVWFCFCYLDFMGLCVLFWVWWGFVFWKRNLGL